MLLIKAHRQRPLGVAGMANKCKSCCRVHLPWETELAAGSTRLTSCTLESLKVHPAALCVAVFLLSFLGM